MWCWTRRAVTLVLVLAIMGFTFRLIPWPTARGDSPSWTTMSRPSMSGATGTLYAVWGTSSSDVFAVGQNGTILHYGAPPTPTPTVGGGGCFIATAAYGTPMAEDIQVLRDFRDRYLITNPVGEKLVSTYYRVSPPMADYIVEHPSLKPLVRFALQPAIVFSSVAINTTPMEKIAIASSLVLTWANDASIVQS